MLSKLGEWWRYRRMRRASHRANRAGRVADSSNLDRRLTAQGTRAPSAGDGGGASQPPTP